jgi:hypothetical protein
VQHNQLPKFNELRWLEPCLDQLARLFQGRIKRVDDHNPAFDDMLVEMPVSLLVRLHSLQ